METYRCPECNAPLDEGLLSVSGSSIVGYISKKQTAMLKVGTQIRRARACSNCGYVEMVLDPNEL